MAKNREQGDASVRVAFISGGLALLGVIISTAGALALGWLDYRGPGSAGADPTQPSYGNEPAVTDSSVSIEPLAPQPQAQPQVTSSTSSTSTSTTVEVAPTRLGDNVRIQNGTTSIDFDSSAPDWGIAPSHTEDGNDMFVGTISRASHGTFGWAVAVSGEPSIGACSDPSAVRWDGYIARSAMLDDSSFCIQTSEGGWAWIHIDSFVQQSDEGYGITVMDITYWDRQAVESFQLSS